MRTRMPSATASPCNSRSENPAAASNAWPKVWPRLSSARSPVSRSSRETMPALPRQHTAMAFSRAGPPANTSCQFASSQPKNAGIAKQSVFRDLGIAGAKLALRQRVEQRGIGEHQHRLMERADEILAVRRVDAGLAADRGVDLRQQRGRHLHEIKPAPHAGRGKAGEIADHAAAQRDHQIIALDARRDQRVADLFEGGVVFRSLARRHDDVRTRDLRRLERGLGVSEMMIGNRLVSDDGGLGVRPQRFETRAKRSEQPAADDDVIAARAKRDVDGESAPARS